MKKLLCTILLLLLAGCYSVASSSSSSLNLAESTPQVHVESPAYPLRFDVIQLVDYVRRVGVQTKITNRNKRDIRNCLATCMVYDNTGEELGFEKHYVVKSLEGGLSAGASTHFEYVIDASPNIVTKVSFHIEHINWK